MKNATITTKGKVSTKGNTIKVVGATVTPKEVKKASKAGKASKAKAKKVPSTPKVSKAICEKVLAISNFDKDKASAYKRLLIASKIATVANMGLNKAVKHYIQGAKEVLTPAQIKCVTFPNVCKHIAQSKFKNLTLFSNHQITLICNGVIKANDANTARSARVASQNKAQAKK